MTATWHCWAGRWGNHNSPLTTHLRSSRAAGYPCNCFSCTLYAVLRGKSLDTPRFKSQLWHSAILCRLQCLCSPTVKHGPWYHLASHWEDRIECIYLRIVQCSVKADFYPSERGSKVLDLMNKRHNFLAGCEDIFKFLSRVLTSGSSLLTFVKRFFSVLDWK